MNCTVRGISSIVETEKLHAPHGTSRRLLYRMVPCDGKIGRASWNLALASESSKCKLHIDVWKHRTQLVYFPETYNESISSSANVVIASNPA